MRYGFDKLVGARVDRVFCDSEYLVFDTTSGRFCFVAEGDCCSRTWIEHLSGLDQLIGAAVSKIEEIDMPELTQEQIQALPDDERDDCVQQYATKIHTDKGYALLEYRNASNGYYGGSMCETAQADPMPPELKEDF